jgi:hypothetical protein
VSGWQLPTPLQTHTWDPPPPSHLTLQQWATDGGTEGRDMQGAALTPLQLLHLQAFLQDGPGSGAQVGACHCMYGAVKRKLQCPPFLVQWWQQSSSQGHSICSKATTCTNTYGSCMVGVHALPQCITHHRHGLPAKVLKMSCDGAIAKKHQLQPWSVMV